MSLRRQPARGHGGALPALSLADLTLDRTGEPRVRDTDIAARLGFAKGGERQIRRLVERHRAELEQFGPLACQRDTSISGKGRRSSVDVYLLNEEQALTVATVSRAPHAPTVRGLLIKVFVAWRRGGLSPREERSGEPRRRVCPIESQAPEAILTEVDLAGVLGLAYPDEVRSLIGRHARALKGFGALDCVPLRTGARGRPSKIYALNVAQGFFLMRAAAPGANPGPPRDAERAAATRAMEAVVDLAEEQAADLGRLSDVVQRIEDRDDALAAEIADARARLAALERRPALRPAERVAARQPGDMLALFLDGCTRPDPKGRVQASVLHDAWSDWCRIIGVYPGGARAFAAQMMAAGYARLKNNAVFYLGLALQPKEAWAAESTLARAGGEA